MRIASASTGAWGLVFSEWFPTRKFHPTVLRSGKPCALHNSPARGWTRREERESTMAKSSDHEVSPEEISRRSFLQVSASAAIAGVGAFGVPGLAAAAEGGLVALVHTQAAGDNGPIDSMIAALKKLSGEKKFPIRTIYAQDAATYGTIFKSLADANAAVIAATFNEVAEPIKALAPKYPKTKWIQIFGDPIQPPIPNFETVSYDYYLGCYLSGLFAAKMSKTGKIGYIGGVSLPPLNADVNSLKAAIASVNPSDTFTPAFAGSFQDPREGARDR